MLFLFETHWSAELEPLRTGPFPRRRGRARTSPVLAEGVMDDHDEPVHDNDVERKLEDCHLE